MSDEDRTEPRAPAATGGVVSGEADLPLEHTARVRAARGEDAAPTQVKVHDRAPTEAAPRSSTELAERARRQRRRERDRRAEKRAIAVVVGGLVALGGAALFAVNYLWEEPPPSPPVAAKSGEGASNDLTPPPPPPRPGVISTALEETPDLPVLRYLRREGLTIGAEGLPETLVVGAGPGPQRAAMESCRYAYGVWELSPNRRFRFLTTCQALQGQVLVGAYEVKGTKVKMSPLSAGGVALVTELELKKPTQARTQVLDAQGAPVLEVRQRLTAIRQGLDGEAFRDAFAGRNTLTPRGAAGGPSMGAAPPPPPPSRPPAGERDPVLELLQGQ